jgi:hypothetical protein
MTAQAPETGVRTWEEANYRYLLTELERLRLLLRRHILWLRTRRGNDPVPSYQGLAISEEQADRMSAPVDWAAQGRFYARDSEASRAGRSLEAIEGSLRQQLAAFESGGQRTALDALTQLFRLSAFGRDLVLLCLAPELDASFERLYGYVQDDVTRKHATLDLALALFTRDTTQALTDRTSLMPHMPLRLFQVLSLESGPSVPWSSALRLSERVRDYLLGFNRIDDAVVDWLRPIPGLPISSPQGELIDRMVRQLRSSKAQGWPLVEVLGPRGSDKRALARTLADRVGLQMFELNPARLPASGPDRHDALRLIEREAVLSQFGLFLDADADRLTDAALKASVMEAIGQLGVFLVVGAPERVPADREALIVSAPRADFQAQRELWQQALADSPNTVDGRLDDIIEQFHLGPTAVLRVVSAASSRARLASGDPDGVISAEALWDACRTEATAPLDDLAQRITSAHTWDDIVLPDDVFAQIREIGAQVAHRSRVYEAWGFGAKLNRGRGISALFSGPSGTGKTLAAEILANHLTLDLYRIDLSGVVSKYIGETEKNLRRVFDAAEDSGAILFFDEADALFGKRSEVKDSHDRYANIEVNYLLQRMEDYRGLAILATNMKSHMDQAFLRRLRFVVEFPFPDASHRARMWQNVFPSAAPVEALDHAALSRLEIAGGNIKNIALNAAFLASGHGGPISMRDVFQAARREYAKIEKLARRAEFGAYLELVDG